MLVREVERYLKATGMAPSRFGTEALGDPRLVFDLRNGRCPGPRVAARVRAYMERRA